MSQNLFGKILQKITRTSKTGREREKSYLQNALNFFNDISTSFWNEKKSLTVGLITNEGSWIERPENIERLRDCNELIRKGRDWMEKAFLLSPFNLALSYPLSFDPISTLNEWLRHPLKSEEEKYNLGGLLMFPCVGHVDTYIVNGRRENLSFSICIEL